MKRKFITVAEYLNPSIVKPIKVADKEVKQKTANHRRLIARQLLYQGQINSYDYIGGFPLAEVLQELIEIENNRHRRIPI